MGNDFNMDHHPADASGNLPPTRDDPSHSIAEPAFAHRATLEVVAVGILITALLVWTAWSLDRHNESRLLNLQAKQVQSVLAEAIPTTQIPLELGAEIAESSNGDVSKFRGFMAKQVGGPQGFSSASLWQNVGGSVSQATALGVPVSADPGSVIDRAYRSSTFVVVELSAGGRHSLGYAFALPGTGRRFAVYAERPLPADRRARVSSNSAFSDLNYAIYLGAGQSPSHLLTTDIGHFPISGETATVTVPFGDTVLTTVVTARSPLGGALSANLPWIVGVVGVLLTVGAAWLTERLVRRRRHAERAEAEVRNVYGELETLYAEQRTIAETLQRALLPQVLPTIAGIEVAARYLPGAQGVEIGGDWYSAMGLDDERFAFVVGDVSGRGLAAASIMARLRFTIRAHALDGDSAALILDKCARHLDITRDGHFATVLVGIGDLKRQEITIANAGHLAPLLLSKAHTGFIDTTPGLPIGASGVPYASVTFSVTPPATIVAFTDGLVERRGEILDIGLKRLEDAARATENGSLEALLDHVLEDLDGGSSEDDIAILGLRWTT
jgi:serine phosphatase RsbU (regulator of sigma subunit)